MNIERLKELKKVDDFNWDNFKERYEKENGDLFVYRFQIMRLIKAIGMDNDNKSFGYSSLSILDKELLLNELGLIETNRK